MGGGGCNIGEGHIAASAWPAARLLCSSTLNLSGSFNLLCSIVDIEG